MAPRSMTTTRSYSNQLAAAAVTRRTAMPTGLSSYHYQHQPQQQYNHQQRRALHLTPREVEHLQLYQVGRVAQNRLARGIRLNHPEAVALISVQMMEAVRGAAGQYGSSISELMELGQTLLGRRQVLPGVDTMLDAVQIEGTFSDGTKLLTVHHPIVREHGDLTAALEGSFLPVPSLSLFHDDTNEIAEEDARPGQVMTDNDTDIVINQHGAGHYIELSVTNTGDRPIQVGSHYAFVETNRALLFDRRQAIGKRLHIPSGASVRFEPGETKAVTLTPIGGRQNVVTGNRLTDGSAHIDCHDEIMQRVLDRGFAHRAQSPVQQPGDNAMVVKLSRTQYADLYGPTVGDRVRLGDTCLEIRVQRDHTVYGDECKFGGGKTIREGMGQMTGITADLALDTVITNCLIVDACLGIVKADVGIKGNSIVGIGKAGNPDMMEGVDENMIIGNS